MSAINSNLSALGYDMVVALTQKSMDTQRKTTIHERDVVGLRDPTVMLFSVGSKEPMDATAANSLLAASDPFAITASCTNQQGVATTATGNNLAIGNALFAANFGVGIRVVIGSDLETCPVFAQPSILSFPTDADPKPWDYLTYTVSFAKIEVVQMERTGGSNWEIHKYSQENPSAATDFWLFQCKTPLSVVKMPTAFGDFPENQKTALNKAGGKTGDETYSNSAEFNQYALWLNYKPTTFDAVNSSTTVQIDNLVNKDDAISTLFNKTCPQLKWITKAYWDVLQNTGPDKDLNRSVWADQLLITIAPDGTGQNIPSDIDFQFKPYGGGDVEAGSQDQKNLTTLNYLIMQNGKQLPASRPAITWDWMDKAEDVDDDGVIAISRDNVLDSIRHFFTPYLSIILKNPSVDFHDDSHSDQTYINIWFNSVTPPSDAFKLSMVGDIQLLCNWISPGPSKDYSSLGDNPSWAEAGNNVYNRFWLQNVDYNYVTPECRILCTVEVTVTMSAHFTAGAGNSDYDGKIYWKQADFNLNLSVDSSSLVVVPEPIDWNDHSDRLEWKMTPTSVEHNMSKEQIKKTIDSVNGSYDGYINAYYDAVIAKIPEGLEGISVYVYPGGASYSYEDCLFSYSYDLVSRIKYKAI